MPTVLEPHLRGGTEIIIKDGKQIFPTQKKHL